MNYTRVDDISFWLRDANGTAISAKILPMGAPVLSDWQTSGLLNITGGQKCGCSYKGYSIGSEILKVSAVPEPASAVLLLIGAFIAKKRGQNR